MKTKIRKRKRNGANRQFVAFGSVIAILSILVIFALMLVSGKADDSPLKKFAQQMFEPEIPKENIPLYKEAANAYDIPWTLLAAHHRVETKFSAMDPLLSPVGAEGHMQFMPCTFVGWSHPTCKDLGKGNISESEKTDPAIIQEYGGYGVDGNKDGIADPYDLQDALYSAANYLSQHGASEGDLEQAISTYNHSDEYLKDVLFYYYKYEEQY
ncbi:MULTISPECIES: lytic transglycosylase domain-containing protein [Planomicrobium]|uniref:Lytic transglycosylase domain-containing protein n=2 Tax=Planomicrobium okeanokoites TaxID=244 RepID=A0ABV7KMM3_PLAOK|nr:hypothetical protein CXF70_15440 [Planomicrobium sp. MB-3u-38]TAA66764.1 lytic transglycosylase domain-containing protein [Planomicrobium okeanokoites]